jgi:hypothetical protein
VPLFVTATASPLARVAGYFAGRANGHGWVARGLVGQRESTDATLREHLIAALGGTIRPDGSARGGGGALPTIVALHDLIDLQAPEALVSRPLGWVMALQGKPGAFSDGCTAARHRRRVCEHFLTGFFSPAPPTERVAPITLPNGKTYRAESQARFALSCLALEAVVLGGRVHEAAVGRHLDSFEHLLGEWAMWSDQLAPDLGFAALGALAVGPERWGPTVDRLVGVVAANQLADGTWPKADFFNALEALAKVRHPTADPVLARALPALLQRQRDDGSFGSVAQDERALIALRVLVRSGGGSGGSGGGRAEPTHP